jgi:hypothetical protein
VADLVTLVIFHVDLGDRPTPMPEQARYRSFSYGDCLAACVRSARAAQPGAPVILLTDRATPVSADCGFDAVVRRDLARDKVMFERMVAYRDFLADNRGSAVVFVDSDILFARTVAPLFDDPFSIAFTVRRTGIVFRDEGFMLSALSDMPVNGGVIFARSDAGARAFFDEAVARYERIEDNPAYAAFPFALRHWGGDQLVFLEMLWRQIRDYYADPASDTAKAYGARVRFLDGAVYNYAPDIRERLDAGVVRDKHILHCKGDRKQFMRCWAEALDRREAAIGF